MTSPPRSSRHPCTAGHSDMSSSPERPRLLITMGDVAGIGPEIIARASPGLCRICRPVVVGDPRWLTWAFDLIGQQVRVAAVRNVDEVEAEDNVAPCLAATEQNLG